VHEVSVQSGCIDQYPDFDMLMAMGTARSPEKGGHVHARPHSSTFTGVGPGVTTAAPGSSFRALASRGGPSSPFKNGGGGGGGGSILSRSNPMASAMGGVALTSPSKRRLYGQTPFVPGMSTASMTPSSGPFADRPGTAGAIMSSSLDGGHSTATAQQQQQQQQSSYRLGKTIASMLHQQEVVLSRADAKNAARDKVRATRNLHLRVPPCPPESRTPPLTTIPIPITTPNTIPQHPRLCTSR
jgi:hypothetical protein